MTNLLIAYKGPQNAYKTILKRCSREMRIWYETLGETLRKDYIEGTEVLKEIEHRLTTKQAIIFPIEDYLLTTQKILKKLKKNHEEKYILIVDTQVHRLKELKERMFDYIIYIPLDKAKDDSELFERLMVFAGSYYIDFHDLFVYKEIF